MAGRAGTRADMRAGGHQGMRESMRAGRREGEDVRQFGINAQQVTLDTILDKVFMFSLKLDSLLIAE